MAYPALKYISAEEYLAAEKDAFEKHEYFKGEVVAMAGASEKHNRIVGNLITEIGQYLKGGNCRVYPSDFRVTTPLSDSYMYPDVSIVCGPAEMKDGSFDTLTNPSVIIEVMSERTANNDKGYKYFFYLQIPSLREYILVDSARHHVEVIRLQSDRKWEIIKTDDADGLVSIESIGMQLSMTDVYYEVAF